MSKAKKPETDTIKTSEHVFISGRTGTGKSVLARTYLSQFPSVVMLDTKGEALEAYENGQDPWEGVDPAEITMVQSWRDLDQVETPFIIYTPTLEESNVEDYDQFFKWAYLKKNITVWVDEAMSISKNSQSIPFYYNAILTRGRSRNTSVWSLTQRPSGLHSNILSQCTHIFSFNLVLPQDKDKLYKVTGAEEFLSNPQGYNFWYWRDGYEDAVKARLKLD